MVDKRKRKRGFTERTIWMALGGMKMKSVRAIVLKKGERIDFAENSQCSYVREGDIVRVYHAVAGAKGDSRVVTVYRRDPISLKRSVVYSSEIPVACICIGT